MVSPKILVVDDDAKILFAFRQLLRKEGYQSIVAKDGRQALRKIGSEQPAAVFMDITMPQVDGLEVLERVKNAGTNIPIIIITGFGTMQTAIKAVQLGAFEYLTKPLDVARIREVMQRALGNPAAVPTSPEEGRFPVEFMDRYELIGSSIAMQNIYKLVGSISTTPNQTPVLITGKSGTGKELVARAIHSHGANRGQPFIGLNCAAFPDTLLESELFGHERGAFTGARERNQGKFEAAGEGTIFLDEIGNLSEHLQQKLLRVLQEREFERLGGNERVPVRARFIAATNKDIEAEVEAGSFRQDLFFRLNVARVHLPSLSERSNDIPALVQYFLAKYNSHLKKSVKGFTEEAMQMLLNRQYQGNVRELENIVERGVMLTRSTVVSVEELCEVRQFHRSESTDSSMGHNDTFKTAKNAVLDAFEKGFVVELLRKHKGNVTAAAEHAQMTRQNLQRLMRRHHIDSKSFR